jgi:hypothetical protein
MKDAFNTKISVGDSVVFVTLLGHKPVLNRATVLQAEEERIQVRPFARSIEPRYKVREMRWLHQPENTVKVSMNV